MNQGYQGYQPSFCTISGNLIQVNGSDQEFIQAWLAAKNWQHIFQLKIEIDFSYFVQRIDVVLMDWNVTSSYSISKNSSWKDPQLLTKKMCCQFIDAYHAWAKNFSLCNVHNFEYFN